MNEPNFFLRRSPRGYKLRCSYVNVIVKVANYAVVITRLDIFATLDNYGVVKSGQLLMIVTTAGYVSTAGEVQRKYSKSLLLLVVKLLLRNKQELFIHLKEMDLETTQTNAAAKLLLLKQDEYEMWRIRLEQYFQIQDYAIWDDAKTLFAAIQTRFVGNDARKKTQKTLLKQMYENINAPSTESLDSIFNRLQKIVSQLAILGENISQEDLNLKHNDIDDHYNNFKIVEQEVKRIVTSSSNSNSSSQNMAFVSSPSSTNEVNTANVQVSIANSPVSTADSPDSTTNLSDATVYAFLANQPNGSQLVHEDLEQIHEDDLEEMDLKWQLALLSMRARRYFQRTGKKITINGSDTAGYDKSKVECFNCHKMGHFARECRGPRNQDNRNRNQDSSRRTVNVEETSSKDMVAIDGAIV
ncbi:putative ribonuclease H-like domain-containing protein [Tanacetum coccineum]